MKALGDTVHLSLLILISKLRNYCRVIYNFPANIHVRVVVEQSIVIEVKVTVETSTVSRAVTFHY